MPQNKYKIIRFVKQIYLQYFSVKHLKKCIELLYNLM